MQLFYHYFVFILEKKCYFRKRKNHKTNARGFGKFYVKKTKK